MYNFYSKSQYANLNCIFLVYTEFILVRLWRKFLAYINTFESVPGTKQYWAISVKFLAQGNNSLSVTGFKPMRLAILRLVRHVNHSTTPPQYIFLIYQQKEAMIYIILDAICFLSFLYIFLCIFYYKIFA